MNSPKMQASKKARFREGEKCGDFFRALESLTFFSNVRPDAFAFMLPYYFVEH